MGRNAYTYRFSERVDLEDAETTLLLAMLATEGLFGRARVRMDAWYAVDESINVIVIDASTPVGMAVSLIFTAFVTAEFGPSAFNARRVQLLSETEA